MKKHIPLLILTLFLGGCAPSVPPPVLPEKREGEKGGLTDELADIIIYSLAFANRNGIDVAKAVNSKMKKNKLKYPANKFKGRF